MQGATITLPEHMLRAVQAHLFQPGVREEQGGFLLCTVPAGDPPYRFAAVDWVPLHRRDYVIQATDYLELTDEARIRIIKVAHDTNTALVEVHCHPGNYPACFSHADIAGLDEFVPHIRWRLKGKPYGALVFAQRSVDGLAWFGTSKAAMSIECIAFGTQRLQTTGLTGQIHGEVQHG
jgi:hypothetical protein